MYCLHCNKPIVSKRNTKKYCSNTCKQYSYLNRNAHIRIPSVPEILTNTFKEEGVLTSVEPLKHVVPEDEIGQYEYIRPVILEELEGQSIRIDISKKYFQPSSSYTGITRENFSAFSFVLPRIRCIIENLFSLSYKKKVHYGTISFLLKGVNEILVSDKYDMLPTDFPFTHDLEMLHKQLNELSEILKEDKEGIKFTLERRSIVRFLLILNLIRSSTTKTPFPNLFPHFYKNTA